MNEPTPEEMLSREERLANYDGDDRVVNLAEQAGVLALGSGASLHVKSALPALEHYVQGFESGELILLSGPPKSGKSLLLQTLSCHFVKDGQPSLWFSYEMAAKEFIARFPADAALNFLYAPMNLTDSALVWIEDRMIEAACKFNVKIAMIDHLHYLVDFEKLHNPSIEIGAVLRGLKRIAVRNAAIVFLIAHTAKILPGQRPSAACIRDSSFCLQEPDTVIMIWREDDTDTEENMAIVSVEMTRRSGVREKRFRVQKKGALLVEVIESRYDANGNAIGDSAGNEGMGKGNRRGRSGVSSRSKGALFGQRD